MRLRTALLSLLPGAAHIDLGRTKRGLVYFAAFAFFLNGALIAPFLASGGQVRAACLMAAAGVGGAAFWEVLRATRPPARRPETPAPRTAAAPAKER